MAPLDFSALNFYHIRDGQPGQAYPWLKDTKVIEPHRETILTVSNPSEEHNYRWVLRVDETDEVQASVSGTEVAVILTQLDEHVITLEEVNPAGLVTRHLEETVIVKYVRREIRTLTEVERGELLDSMHQLWAVSKEDGKEIYGDNYVDIWTINKLHHLGGSGYTCDHFHDGVGFLTSHVLLTNIFERSLQIVNPKLSLPYWDFTIEASSSRETKYDPSDPTSRTPLLDPSWFGTFDPNDQMVKDGRWAYTEIPRVQKDNMFETLRSDVYGKLRSPWNVNQRPYMTRGAGKMCDGHIEQSCAWPTCDLHYNLVKDYDDFISWSWESMYWPHGPVHFWLGGFLDCAQTYDKIAQLVGSTMSDALAAMSFNHRKILYWDGIWYCEGTVDEDTPPEDVFSSGMCGCHGFDLTQGDDYKTISAALKLSKLTPDFDDLEEDVQREIVSILCSSVLGLGEQTQSSSSLDPMFWPMHPTMERIWQLSILTGHITDFTWPDHDITYHGPDQTPVERSLSMYTETCVGHRGSDAFPFGILESDIEGFDVEVGMLAHDGTGVGIPNRDVLAAVDPRVGNVTYIYDNFKWEHCAADGYNFDDLWVG
ncbi:unnamed protein product [Ascophyllum nodosum]